MEVWFHLLRFRIVTFSGTGKIKTERESFRLSVWLLWTKWSNVEDFTFICIENLISIFVIDAVAVVSLPAKTHFLKKIIRTK